MEIRRTYKPISKKFGQVEIVGEAKAREVFGQTAVARHAREGECGKNLCIYCCEPSIERLKAGGTIETYFSKWELVPA